MLYFADNGQIELFLDQRSLMKIIAGIETCERYKAHIPLEMILLLILASISKLLIDLFSK